MIQLRTLGGVDLRGPDGHEIRSVLVRPKRLALLVYLAQASPRGFHRRDRLLALFWPEHDQARARNALSQALHVLRRGLGEGVLVNRADDEVGLAPGALQCDAAAFEAALERGQLGEALELYRGDLMEGFFPDDTSPDFEHWLEAERARLRRLAVQAALALTSEDLAGGNLALALPWSRRALALAPYDETAMRSHLEVLDRSGDVPAALRAFEQFAARLAAELELEPSPELLAYVEGLRSRRADPEVVSAAPAAAPPPFAAEDGRVREPLSFPPLRTVVRRWLMPAAGLAGVALVLAAFAAAREDRPMYEQRVAVAPLENLTGDPAMDPIGRMAADWITQGLTETDFIEVVDVQTALATSRDLAKAGVTGAGPSSALALARETAARTVISGAYYRDGDSLQFHVQVSDARRGRLVQGLSPVSAHVGSPLDAITHLRDRVLASLADRLDPRLAFFEPKLATPPSYDAYVAYAQGLEVFLTENFAGAAKHFDRAIEIDPAFLRARLWAAQSHAFVGGLQSDTAHWVRADSILRVLEGARSQLSLYDRHHLDFIRASYSLDRDAIYQVTRQWAAASPGSANAVREAAYWAIRRGRAEEGIELLRQLDHSRGILRVHDSYWRHLAFAYHQMGDFRGELREAKRGRELDPRNVHRLRDEAVALAALGHVDELHEVLDQIAATGASARLNPGQAIAVAAWELRAHGHAEAAQAVVRRALVWHHGRSPEEKRTPGARQDLADALYLAGRWEEARAIYEELASIPLPSPHVLGRLGTIAARQGDRERAREISARLAANAEKWLARPKEEHLLARARIAAVSGNTEEALLLLRHYGDTWSTFHADVDLESLWDDPRFQTLALVRPKE